MRGFFATVPADLNAEDAAVVLAEAELLDAWRRHDALFRALEAATDAPVISMATVEMARQRMTEAGVRLAQLPASGLPGLAVKVHYLALDVLDGHSLWSETLARHVLADLRRLVDGGKEETQFKKNRAPRP